MHTMGRRTRKRARLNTGPQERSPRSDQKAQRTDVIANDDEPRRPLWPFLAAFAIFAALMAYIFLIGGRGDSGPTNAQKIRTLTEQYVAAHNDGDSARLQQLSCPGLADKDAPLTGEPKGISIVRMRSESPEPGIAKADVRLRHEGKDKDTEWWYKPEGNNWLVCHK
jgi:hypothetical protein